MSGAEVPLSWVDNWYSDANGDSVIDLDEINYAVLTRGETVNQLSDLYLNFEDLEASLDTNGDNYISAIDGEFTDTGTHLWVDADRNFAVGAGELLEIPAYFEIHLPGQPYEGTYSGGLSIIEYAIYVLAAHLIHLLVGFMVLVFHIQALRLLLDQLVLMHF